MIGIQKAATVETRNWKWLRYYKMGKNTLFSVVPKLRSADGSRFVIKIAGKQTGKQKKKQLNKKQQQQRQQQKARGW